MTDYLHNVDGRLDESKPTINMFEEAINQWGVDRNITAEGGATVMSQMSKMMEEFAEFLQTWDQLQILSAETGSSIQEILEGADGEDKVNLARKLDDDFGDMLVCLIQAMRLAYTDMESCLACSWADIKDRGGRMEGGKFIKESS